MKKRAEVYFPDIFWKYFDSYRRREISKEQFVEKTGLSKSKIDICIHDLKKEQFQKRDFML